AVRVDAGTGTVELRCEAEVRQAPVWFMEQVAVGPLHEVTALVGAGLSYSSVPWATHAMTNEPAVVGPGTFLDIALPDGVSATGVALADGPDWALGGARIVTSARGERRLLLSIDLVRYAMQRPGELERARRVVVRLE
ncbi:MAG: hypothetical protein KDE27_02005, partial [Planctomycetes bacterium]|nr:hypothetical protein [Planctomycetota bacterium]